MPSEAPQHSQQASKALSCLQCRKRKAKCDRLCPCGPCRMRGDEEVCTAVTQTVAHGGHVEVPTDRPVAATSLSGGTVAAASAAPSSISDIEARLGRIESMLSKAFSHNDEGPSRKRRRSTAADSPGVNVHGPSQRGLGEHIQALMEDVAMGHRNKMSKERGLGLPRLSQARTDGALNQRSSDSPMDVAFAFLQLCPPAEHVEIIIDHYFAYADWTTRVLHGEDVRRAMIQISMTPTVDAVQVFSSSSICLYFAILALGLHFSTSGLLYQVEMDSKKAMRLADTMFSGCQQLLWASDFLGTFEIDHLACVALISVYLHNRKDQADAFWSLLGAGIKIGQNLGLSRLKGDAEPTADHELAKRTWWNLVWHDWSHASAHYGCYSVQPTQNTSPLPLNANIQGPFALEKPDQEYTEATFTIHRLRYCEIYRQIVDARNEAGGPLDAEQVADFSKALDNVRASLPQCISYRRSATDSPSQSMERATLELMYQNRILRLHRDRQLAGYHHAEWVESRKASVHAALAIVQVAEREVARHSPLIQFWLVVFYLLGASTALVMEICNSRVAPQELSTERTAVEKAVKLLTQAGSSSEAARNSRRVLRELLAAEEQVRSVVNRPDFASRMANASLEGQGTELLSVFHEILQRASGSQPEPVVEPQQPVDLPWIDWQQPLTDLDSTGNDATMKLLFMTFGQQWDEA